MIAKLIAKLMVKNIMLEAASDKDEETIKLIKKPGKNKSKELEIRVRFECVPDRIAIYMVNLVESAAEATHISFDEMIQHIKTTRELMYEISEVRDLRRKITDNEGGQG